MKSNTTFAKYLFSLPYPQIPQLYLIPDIIMSSIGIAIVSVAVHISMAKIIAKKMGYTVDAGQVDE